MKKPFSQLVSLLLVLGMVLSGPAQAAELSIQEQNGTSVSAASLSEEDVSATGQETPDASSADSDSADADASSSEDSDSADESLTVDNGPADNSPNADSDSADNSPSADNGPADESSATDSDSADNSPAADRDPADAPSETGPDPAASASAQSVKDASVSSEDDGPIAQHLTARSADDLSDILADQWRDDYFQEAVVDTRRNRVEVDGRRTGVREAFGPEADSGEILDSPEAAEAYFEETPYEAEVDRRGLVHVTDPWQARRIIVEAKSLPEDYGAELVIRDVKYHRVILQFPDQASTAQAYETLSRHYSCWADQILFADDLLQEAESETWGAEYMGFRGLLSSSSVFDGAETIQVAIIDSGCVKDNPFFGDRAFSEASKSIVDDGSPYTDMNNNHGTHVAGIVHSCTPANVELMILRIYKGKTTNLLTADNAVRYALEKGAEVINFSSAQIADDASSLTDMDGGLAEAREAGVPVVCAAGNSCQDVSKSYPACKEDAVAVSAINRNGEFAATYSSSPNWSNLGTSGSGSAYGSGIDFCAPGVDVVSAVGTGTGTKSGTSMAAPHITAAFACLRLLNPGSSYDELYEQLKGICVDLQKRESDEDCYPGRDDYYGWGCPDLSELMSGHVHQWTVENVVAPTCTRQGYTVYKCSQCGQERSGSFVAPAHSFNEDGTCTVCRKTLVASCGEGVTWSFDSASCTLTLTGSGSVSSAPWEDLYADQYIHRLVLNGVTGLDNAMFADYPYLKFANLGKDLESLGEDCFSGCPRLTQISLPESLRTIGARALTRCGSLVSITSDSSSFPVSGGTLLLGERGARLLLCAGGRTATSCTVPEGVTAVAPHAFDSVGALKTLILPTSLTRLEENAITNCARLKNIYARSNVETLEDNCFNGLTAALSVSEGCTGWEDSADKGGTITQKSYPGNMGDPNQWTMALSAQTWTYTGLGRCPGIKMTHGQKGDDDDNDYQFLHNYTLDGEAANHSGYFTYSYSNNVSLARSTDANAPTATVTGKGIYFGSQSVHFDIKLATPALKDAVSGLKGVDLSWDSVPGAAKYQMMRKEGDGAWSKLKGAVTTATNYTDTTAEAGKTYSYSLYAIDESGKFLSNYNGTGKSVHYVPAPVLKSAKIQEDGSVLVSWTGSSAAAKYLLLRQNDDGDWEQIAETASESAADPNPTQGADSLYTVRAVAADETESAVPAGISVSYLSAPVLSGGVSEGKGVRLSWAASDGAVRYRVSCKTTGGWKAVGDTTETSLLITTSDGRTALRDGVACQFAVRCVSADGSSYASALSEPLSATYLAGPTLSAPSVQQSSLQLRYSVKSGAAAYLILRKDAKGVWQQIGETTAIRFYDQSPLIGENTYTVRYRKADGTLSSYGNSVTQVLLSKPVVTSAVCEGSGVRLKWQKSSGAKRYQVLCQRSGGTWQSLTTTTKTNALVKICTAKGAPLVTGTTYRFSVRCVSADGKQSASGWSNGRAAVFVQGSALTSVKNVKTRKLTVKWQKIARVTGYQVQIAQNASFTRNRKTLRISGQKWSGASFKSLKKGSYWVRVRCYRTISGTDRWSGWSGVKRIAVKK